MRLLVVVVLTGACSFEARLGAPTDTPTGAVPACVGKSCRRRAITIDHTKVTGGPHDHFPLLVIVPELDAANVSGADIVFTDGVTTLPHERELRTFNDLVAWVAVPSLSSAVDTTIYMYDSDPNAAVDQQDRAGVWDEGYVAVWHLAESSTAIGGVRDSTRSGNAGTGQNGVGLGMPGKIAGGARFDGVDDCIRIPQSTSLSGTAGRATIGMWVNWTASASGQSQRLLMSTNTFANDFSGMEWASDGAGVHYYYPSDAGGATSTNFDAIANPFTNGSWHYLVLVQRFDTKAVRFFVDGNPVAQLANNTPQQWANLTKPADWYWGGVPPRTQFIGMIDEIRVSSTIRSDGWIATEFANQSAPSNFYTLGPPVRP